MDCLHFLMLFNGLPGVRSVLMLPSSSHSGEAHDILDYLDRITTHYCPCPDNEFAEWGRFERRANRSVFSCDAGFIQVPSIGQRRRTERSPNAHRNVTELQQGRNELRRTCNQLQPTVRESGESCGFHRRFAPRRGPPTSTFFFNREKMGTKPHPILVRSKPRVRVTRPDGACP